MANVIYQMQKGKMKKVGVPRLPNNCNFVIRWKGLDWSGFRTLADCEKQFAELESRLEARGDSLTEDFEVVET